MMTRSLTISARDRRVLLLGTAVLLGLALVGRGLPALQAWRAKREAEASTLDLRLQRARAAVRDLDRNRRLLAEAQARLSRYDSALLSGLTTTSAAAHLSELLGEAASSSDAELGAVQLSADSAARTALSRVTARTEVTGNLESIALFLDALEEGPRFIAVRELNITSGTSPANPAQRELLRVALVVEGVFPTPRRQGGRR